MPDKENPREDFSFKNYFVPFSDAKAIHWIIIIGLIVFANMLFNGFVWDDRTFIQLNPDVQHLDILYLLRANMFNNINAGQYRFFVALYFTFLHTLFGDSTFFYHIFQLVIHIANTILIFHLLKRFFKIELSFFLALLFLIHPIQVESVSYIASSDNPLFTLFGLIALNLNIPEKLSKKRIFASFSLLLLSLLSKETGILFVILVVLYRFLFQKKYKVSYLLFGFTTVALYCFIRFAIAGVYFSKVLLPPITRIPLPARLINVPAVIFYYIKTFLLPVHLVITQYWVVTTADFQHFYLPLFFDMFCFLLLASFGVYLWNKKRKAFSGYIFFCIWLAIGLDLYSQIFALDMTVADRWFYFPFIGLLGVLGFIFQDVKVSFLSKKVLWSFGIIIIIIFSIRTMVRNTNWQDPITLYSHDSTIQDNFEIENSLGGELNLANRPAEALIHFKKSVAMFPHETNLFNLGLSYEQKDDLVNAEKYYSEAFMSKSYGQVPYPYKHQEVTYVRFALVTLQSDPQMAVEIINQGITDYPNDPKMWYAKAQCEYKLHNHSAALNAARMAYQLLPDNQSTINLYNQLFNNQPINTSLK